MIKSILSLVLWLVFWFIIISNAPVAYTALFAVIEIAGAFGIGMWIGIELFARFGRKY